MMKEGKEQEKARLKREEHKAVPQEGQGVVE